MLTQNSNKTKSDAYAETIYQLLSGVNDPVVAVRRARASWKAWEGSSSELRSILRAAGAFTRNNDGYFLRYDEGEAELEQPLRLPQTTHMLVLPVPVEPRMRVAYSYMQGLLLKYLYTKYGAIPQEVHQGLAQLFASEPLPEADELWTEFLNSGVAESAIAASASNWTAGSNIGKQAVDDAFISDSYLLGLAKAIANRPSAFQWQGGDQVPAFRKDDLGELDDRDALMTRDDPEASEFRKANRYKEWSTLEVYEWLEKESRKTKEFEELVEISIKALQDDEIQEVSLQAASDKLEEAFRAEFVPRSSRPDWTALAVPKIMVYLLLWALVDRFSPSEEGAYSFLGWNLSYLKSLRESFESPRLRGSLKFMEKNDPKRGTKTLFKLTGFDKLKVEVRLVKEEADSLSAAPFDLSGFGDVRRTESGIDSGGKVCTVCGKSGELSTASILPESKKRHYDSPQTNNPADVCARCVQVWSLSPISTADDNYSIVEVPVENFLELFALYESLEGINRLETLKTLNKVSSLAVFPNKYLLLSRSSGKGKMPQVAQYYLQLARQPHFLKRLKENAVLEVIAAQDRAKMAREVSLVLSTLRRIPPYYVTSSDDKVPAMSIINALDRGRPYAALYVAAAQAQEAGRGETQTISDGVSGYDNVVGEFQEFFIRRQKGEGMSKEMFRDVREFSDYLYSILRPIVREEVKSSGSSVSGVSRKYTENITKSFVRVNTADFLYRISSFVEGRERQNPDKDGWIKWTTKKSVEGNSNGGEDSEETQPTLKLERELESYYEQYSSNQRDWKTFLEEVEARTLALLLLNVSNKKKG